MFTVNFHAPGQRADGGGGGGGDGGSRPRKTTDCLQDDVYVVQRQRRRSTPSAQPRARPPGSPVPNVDKVRAALRSHDHPKFTV